MNNLAVPSDDDLWQVQLGNGEVCTFTLDMLDEAFDAGIVHERTYVWKEGQSEWMTLGQLAGLDSPQESVPFSAGVVGQTHAPIAYSTAPMASDVDLDIGALKPRKRRGARVVLAAAMVALIGYGVTARHELVSRYRTYFPAPAIAAPLVNAATPLTPEPLPVAAATTAAPPPAPAATDTSAPPSKDDRLSDDQKRALLAVDKVHADTQKAKASKRAVQPAPTPRKKGKSDNPFHKGGSRYDPLNASL